ncbi:monocarboxylate transporter 12-like isoform X2 [Clavelina lepadiformis]|uniref:monocarboxylate transporter 12-like isoform X2 n=1 Tax=Clavelina lepadiformis TaxID=159417 RepID=UPI004042D89B
MTSANVSLLILASGVFVWTLWSAAFKCYSTFYQSLMFEFELKYGDVSWMNGFAQGGYSLGRFCLAGSVIGVFTMLPRYFKKNREVVLQIACGGLSMGSFIYCPLFQVFIDVFQWRGALWIISGIFLQPAIAGALLGFPPPVGEDVTLRERDFVQIEQFDTELKEVEGGVSRNVPWRLRLRHLCIRWDFVIFLRPNFYLLVLAWFTYTLCYYSSLLFLIPYGSKIGLTDIQASSLASAVGFGELGSRVFYSVVMNRCPHTYRYIFLTGAVALTGFIVFPLSILKSYAGLMSVSATVGVLGGGADAVFSAIMIDLFGVAKYSSVFGYTNVITYIMGMLGVVALGNIIDLFGSETIAFIIGGCSLLLSSGFILLINSRIRTMATT